MGHHIYNIVQEFRENKQTCNEFLFSKKCRCFTHVSMNMLSCREFEPMVGQFSHDMIMRRSINKKYDYLNVSLASTALIKMNLHSV